MCTAMVFASTILTMVGGAIAKTVRQAVCSAQFTMGVDEILRFQVPQDALGPITLEGSFSNLSGFPLRMQLFTEAQWVNWQHVLVDTSAVMPQEFNVWEATSPQPAHEISVPLKAGGRYVLQVIVFKMASSKNEINCDLKVEYATPGLLERIKAILK